MQQHRQPSAPERGATQQAQNDSDTRPVLREWQRRAAQFAADVTAGKPVDPEVHGRFLATHFG